MELEQRKRSKPILRESVEEMLMEWLVRKLNEQIEQIPREGIEQILTEQIEPILTERIEQIELILREPIQPIVPEQIEPILREQIELKLRELIELILSDWIELILRELIELILRELIELKLREQIELKQREQIELKLREQIELKLRELIELKLRELIELKLREQIELKLRKQIELKLREWIEPILREWIERILREWIELKLREQTELILREQIELFLSEPFTLNNMSVSQHRHIELLFEQKRFDLCQAAISEFKEKHGLQVPGPQTHSQAQLSTSKCDPSASGLHSPPLHTAVQATTPHEEVSMDTISAAASVDPYRACSPTERYRMESTPRGYCLIINNINFVDPAKTRYGAEKDEQILKETLIRLGFQVDIQNNLTADQMLCCIRDFSLWDHREVDCCILAIFSHGSDGNVIDGCDMKKVSLTEVINLFGNDKCELLRGKPKMFTIQACRDRPTSGTQSDGTESNLTDGRDFQDVHPVEIPPKADMVIARSTTEGEPAYRNRLNGSRFIQALAKVLEQDSHQEEVTHMLTKVNGKVAAQNTALRASGAESSGPQTPVFTSSLTKKWYLNPASGSHGQNENLE